MKINNVFAISHFTHSNHCNPARLGCTSCPLLGIPGQATTNETVWHSRNQLKEPCSAPALPDSVGLWRLRQDSEQLGERRLCISVQLCKRVLTGRDPPRQRVQPSYASLAGCPASQAAGPCQAAAPARLQCQSRTWTRSAGGPAALGPAARQPGRAAARESGETAAAGLRSESRM